MLDKTTYPMAPPASITIRGQAIAKTKRWDPRMRARLAAKWKLGLAQIEPTTKLAAEVFGVSVPLVMEETASLEARLAKRAKVNGGGNGMSADQLDSFVRANLLAIWNSFERVTRA
jgi:hypothetical protein